MATTIIDNYNYETPSSEQSEPDIQYGSLREKLDSLFEKNNPKKQKEIEDKPIQKIVPNNAKKQPVENKPTLVEKHVGTVHVIHDKTPQDSGIVCLMWLDFPLKNEFDTKNIKPTNRSFTYMTMYEEYETEEQKTAAINKYSEIIERYESAGDVAKTGKYFILLGKPLKITIQKNIIIE